MGFFSLNTPPTWGNNPYATDAGWVDGVTGELLVAIRGLSTKRTTGATAVSASFATTSNKTKLKTNDVITLTVKFNEKVTVTGTPQLSVTIGGNTRQCNYVSGTTTSSLVFTYTIVGGDTGSWTAIGTAITLNSGTIKDTNDGTTNAVLTGVGALFPSTSGYAVDNAAPTAGDVVIYGGARFTTGNKIKFKVPYSENITVTGTPLLNFDVNGTARTAAFTEVSDGDVFFEYTVVSGDSCTATNFNLTGTITLSGGTLLDAAGNSAPITGLAAEAFIDTIFVNTGATPVAPTISGVVITTGTYGIGDVVPVVATFSQRVAVVGTPTFNIVVGGETVVATYASGSGTTALRFEYTMIESGYATASMASFAANSLTLGTATIKNFSGVDATITHSSGTSSAETWGYTNYPYTITFSDAAHPTYVTDDVFEITFVFETPVTVSGTPRVRLGIGAKNAYCEYVSGTTTDTLIFQYTVVAEDSAPIPGQGFEFDNFIDMNGGSIVDGGSNPIDPTFRRPSKTSISFNA